MSERVPYINLIPSPRRVQRARKMAVHRWMLICGLVGLASLTPAALHATTSTDTNQDFGQRITRAERAIAQLKAEEPKLRKSLAELQAVDRQLRVVEDRPAWLPLFQAVAAVSGGARFERIEAEAGANPSEGVSLRLSVLVPNQTEGRGLVLRLEESGIFESVSLRSSSRVVLASAQVERCEIVAKLALRKSP